MHNTMSNNTATIKYILYLTYACIAFNQKPQILDKAHFLKAPVTQYINML